MNRIIIAIDGFSSCGKSTLAKHLAKHLHYIYGDSGAMYRAVTLFFLRNNIDWKDTVAVEQALTDIHVDLKKIDGKQCTFLNGENIEDEIRGMAVSNKVSPVSAIHAVREAMVAQQRRMGQQRGIVMDGRDIGTVVFPDAELKIFMTANDEVRAQRRYDELTAKGITTSFDEVLTNLKERDYQDSTRAESPLRRADDALILDNTDLDEDTQFDIALKWANERIQNATH